MASKLKCKTNNYNIQWTNGLTKNNVCINYFNRSGQKTSVSALIKLLIPQTGTVHWHWSSNSALTLGNPQCTDTGEPTPPICTSQYKVVWVRQQSWTENSRNRNGQFAFLLHSSFGLPAREKNSNKMYSYISLALLEHSKSRSGRNNFIMRRKHLLAVYIHVNVCMHGSVCVQHACVHFYVCMCWKRWESCWMKCCVLIYIISRISMCSWFCTYFCWPYCFCTERFRFMLGVRAW